MSELDAIPADQRAVLQLVLQQGRSYDEIAQMLRIDPDAVRSRAYEALSALGPESGRIAPDRQAEVTDYLLGQQSLSQREATRDVLAASANARAWARVVSSELRTLARDPLPEVPDEGYEGEAPPTGLEPALAAPALGEPAAMPPPVRPPRPPRAPRPPREPGAGGPSSRLGGALLLAGLGILLAALIVFGVAQLTDDDDDGGGNGTTNTTQTQTTAAEPISQANMQSPRDGSEAVGVAQVVRQGEQLSVLFAGQDLPAEGENAAYALWLYNSPSRAAFLGFFRDRVQEGRLSGGVGVPPNASEYEQIVLTRERAEEPERPGPIILRGPFQPPLSQAAASQGSGSP